MNFVLTPGLAAHFARLALDCVQREYPNKIAHVMDSDADARPPRELTPAFYGCFDWHSAVHGHWLLARAARLFPGEPFAAEARAALERSITPVHIADELRYLEGRQGFERPYGLAWLLALGAELRSSEPDLAQTLLPLATAAAAQLEKWLEKLARPDRSGQHFNTAFALGLVLDSDRGSLRATALRRARDYYFADRNAPLAYEPSGEDFLSPCLAEADLMRRVLDRTAFAEWFSGFLPHGVDLHPAVSPDRSDGKLAHLDGLNLSRAWMLAGVSSALPSEDPRRATLTTLAQTHAAAGLAAITGEHYEGAHWLGTFAMNLLTHPAILTPDS
jgi:Protein of unknown function (DUF2891)